MQAALVPLAQVMGEFNTGYNLRQQILGMQQAFQEVQDDILQLSQVQLFHTYILLSRIIGLPGPALAICRVAGVSPEVVERQVKQHPDNMVCLDAVHMYSAIADYLCQCLPQFAHLWPQQPNPGNLKPALSAIEFPIGQQIQTWLDRDEIDIRCALLIYFKMMMQTDAKPFNLHSTMTQMQRVQFDQQMRSYMKKLDNQAPEPRPLYS